MKSEANAWFVRNRDKLRDNAEHSNRDPVVEAIHRQAIRPRSILEIGAGNGWRLQALSKAFGATAIGLEPSEEAIADGRQSNPDVELRLGSADSLPFGADAFDLVIFGFCLYLCDPQDLFVIASEADRVLVDGGWLVILDFVPPRPYRNPYSHLPGLFSFKMDHARLFTSHPAYRLVDRRLDPPSDDADPDEIVGVSLLCKAMKDAFPDNPYRRDT